MNAEKLEIVLNEIEEDAFDPWVMNKSQKQYMGAFYRDTARRILTRTIEEETQALRAQLADLREWLVLIRDYKPRQCYKNGPFDTAKIAADALARIEAGKPLLIVNSSVDTLPLCTKPNETECHAHNGKYCMNGIQCPPATDTL